MSYNYPIFNRCIFCIVLLTIFSLSTFTMAQQVADTKSGIVRIKVTEELAQQLERAQLSRAADNTLLTGIKAFDNVSQQYKVDGIQRVFRPAGKFESKHRKYGLHLWYEVRMDKNASVSKAALAYKSMPQVQLSELVYKKNIVGSNNKNPEPRLLSSMDVLPGTSNDPFLTAQWHYNNTGQTNGTAGSDISLLKAWEIETGRSNVIVSVHDGGIQVNHPDLAVNMWINTGEIPNNNIDDDGNGFIDDINGYGFGDNTGTIAPDDHGTHVGGTIAAVTNNSIGVAGVAGGAGSGDGVRLMSCAVFGENDEDGFPESYVYAADNGAIISQNSWGYFFEGQLEQVVLDAIDYFIAEAGKNEMGVQVGPMNGGLVIFAAGNDNDDGDWYPGFYAPTIAVAGVTHQDRKGWYSNYGPWVDIAAPGGETNNIAQQGVLSTVANNQYGFFQGTSMAAPHVSGVAALIISKFGGAGLTPAAVRARLIQTTDNIDAAHPQFVGLLGSGRLNAFAALQQNDNAPPNAINDLSAIKVGITSITLRWTAPADSGNASATSYDIRYATSPITEETFNAAEQIANPPVPKPAGAIETVEVTGLFPGTTYYFAVKSADFFGNISTLSNVVEQATNFPPAISVSPDSLVANLLTAQITIDTLIITNTGQGPLEFSFVNDSIRFATPSPKQGTIPPGSSETIHVTLNANNLLAGTYREELILATNDPMLNMLNIPVVLHVTNNNEPIASVAPDTLDFGQVFVGGSVNRTLSFHNAGSASLVVQSISSDNSDFVVNFQDSLSIGSFRDTTITVTYTASTLGVSMGALSIQTNDPDNSILTVFMEGEGVESPGIVVSPNVLSATLNTGDTTTQLLTIQNPGASTLEISIGVSPGIDSTIIVSKKHIQLPERDLQQERIFRSEVKMMSSKRRSSKQSVTLKSVHTSAVVKKILIITPDEDVSDLTTILDGFEDVEADVFPSASLPGISLSDLAGYDVVMTTNNTKWLEAGNVSPVVIGNLLADYIDQGGKLIINQFAYSYDDWKMEGRFITEQYGPFIPATTDANISTSLGTILTPQHPVMQGVGALSYEGFVQNVSLAPGATALANWSTGDLFVAVNQNVVGLNMLPSLGDGNPLQWEGDLPTLYQNAIHWLSGVSFISVNPTSASIAPGEQTNLRVTFNAAGLVAGTYEASLNITTNVPDNELVAIPAILSVLGPEFTVTPDSLYEIVEKGDKVTRTLTLTNNGSGTHSFQVSINNKGLLGADIVRMDERSRREEVPIVEKRETSYTGKVIDLSSKQIIRNTETRTARSELLAASDIYVTNFEEFQNGNINGQQGWAGEFGNWTIESANPFSGQRHFRGLADGLGQSLAFSPEVAVGSESKSTTTMKLAIQGTSVTWQIIPQSVSSEFVNTRVEFSPNGSARALVDDGVGGARYDPIAAAVPTGYFDLTIEIDRATFVFDVYFNENKVFTGQGFAGGIEQVVVFSLMESFGPTFDMDDLKIIDGARTSIPSYLSVSPISGDLDAGESVEINVHFDASQLDFGTYHSDIVIDIASIEQIIVPTFLQVTGDAAIDVDPTVLQATVAYKEDTTKNIKIKNTGGVPLTYSMQVIGANTENNKLITKQSAVTDKRILEKQADDDQRSRKRTNENVTVIQLLTGTSLLEENFEASAFPPTGWSVVDNEGNGVVWGFAASVGEGNYCGTGEAATASSDAAGVVEFDTELISPLISTAGFKDITLQFNANYQNLANLDFLDVDIITDSDPTWRNLLRWNEDHGNLHRLPGEFVTLALDEFLQDATSFRIRWHYYDPNPDDFDWYAQIDDVVILGNPRVWLTVNPASGTVPVGDNVDVTARFNAEDLNPGFYVAGILVSSNAVEDQLVGIVASLNVMKPSILEVEPDALHQEIVSGHQATQTIQISNVGESPLRFTFEGVTMPAASEQKKERRSTLQARTAATATKIRLDDPAAIIHSTVRRTASKELYATSFEEFAPGDIDGQEGWTGQFENWTIENDNAFMGDQHLRSVSDGLGVTLAFSPEVAIGNERISSTTMKLNLKDARGVTWQVIPQSITASLVNTRIQINPDGSLQALVVNAQGGAGYMPISASAPNSYFELRIDIERATSLFTVYIDGVEVFSGQGFAGDIEQVVILSAMEVPGPLLDVDNLAIFDGEPQAPWLFVNPIAGIVGSNSSQNVIVTFDARDLEGGSYTDTLIILSNDPTQPVTRIPVSLNVTPPPVIVVKPGSLHQELYAGTNGSQSLNVANEGVADLSFTFLGYSKNDSTKRNNVSRIYSQKNKLQKQETDAREGHPVLYGRGGPDGGGYSWVDSNEPGGPAFAWVDISSTGTALSLGDDDSVSVSLPFPFIFYGNRYDRITISSNGYLTFGNEATEFSNAEIPDVEEPNNMIAPFWDDLVADATGAAIYFQAEADRFVVQYVNVPAFFSSQRNTFEVILYPNGSIQYQYLVADTRRSATIGIENSSGTDGLQIAFNTDYAKNNLSILITTVPLWVYPQPVSGIIPGGSSTNVDVQFSANELSPGDYAGNLYISSNDLETPLVSIPVSLHVFDNYPPVLDSVDDIMMLERSSRELLVVATDKDDSLVTIMLVNAPDFISQSHVSSGMATYLIEPGLGDAGIYLIDVIAQDARGKRDSTSFQLIVKPYGVTGFSLIKSNTGEVLQDFTDEVTIDVAHPDFYRLNLRANTDPKQVGSVLFRVDRNHVNTDNQEPYVVNPLVLPLLNKGEHILRAEAFTQMHGRGEQGQAGEATIHIINSGGVSGLNVVNTRGENLMDLQEGSVINISDVRFKSISIVASTSARGVRSVKFVVNGKTHHIDNLSPYSLTGDLFGYFLPWIVKPGNYTITAIPYSQPLGLGIEGKPLTVTIQVINAPNVASVRNGAQQRNATPGSVTENEGDEILLKVFPVPLKNEIHIQSSEGITGEVNITIHNAYGQVLYKERISAEELSDHLIVLDKLSISSGIYYLYVEDSSGLQISRKLIKE